jgi:F-type H+-transporting ATPase subunit gamma
MAKTQDIKRRIRSIGNTQKLTRAMKMVSAAKLRRAQQRIIKARPYAHKLLGILRSVAARANPELHPLLQPHEDGNRVELFVLTGDKGLCGSFNTHIIRKAELFAKELTDKQLTLCTVGKRGREYFARRKYEIRREWVDVFRDVQFGIAEEMADEIIEHYERGELDEVYLVYNEFKSAIQCTPTIRPLLPIEPMEFTAGETADDYIYEPDAERLFAALLPHYVQQIVFQALLESVAAEHAARMTAMDNATKNAGELIESLTLHMNKVRQASITTEILEVVSGAEALK